MHTCNSTIILQSSCQSFVCIICI